MSGCPWSLAPEVLETEMQIRNKLSFSLVLYCLELPLPCTMLGDSQGDPVREE